MDKVQWNLEAIHFNLLQKHLGADPVWLQDYSRVHSRSNQVFLPHDALLLLYETLNGTICVDFE